MINLHIKIEGYKLWNLLISEKKDPYSGILTSISQPHRSLRNRGRKYYDYQYTVPRLPTIYVRYMVKDHAGFDGSSCPPSTSHSGFRPVTRIGNQWLAEDPFSSLWLASITAQFESQLVSEHAVLQYHPTCPWGKGDEFFLGKTSNFMYMIIERQ